MSLTMLNLNQLVRDVNIPGLGNNITTAVRVIKLLLYYSTKWFTEIRRLSLVIVKVLDFMLLHLDAECRKHSKVWNFHW